MRFDERRVSASVPGIGDAERSPVTAVHAERFGVSVTAMTPAEVIDWIDAGISSGATRVLGNHNLHSVYLYHADREFAAFYDLCDATIIDGFPVLSAARPGYRALGRRLTSSHRVGTLDWLARLSQSTQVRRLAVVGSHADANSEAVRRLAHDLGDVEVAGWPGDAWTDERAQTVVEALAEWKPDLVLVGLGMPRQERFLMTCLPSLPPAVYATVGGAIDQVSGFQRPAPRVCGALRVEWVWRLVSQPRRLSRRYLVEPWQLWSLLRRAGLTRTARRIRTIVVTVNAAMSRAVLRRVDHRADSEK